jgi:hypothetical protein
MSRLPHFLDSWFTDKVFPAFIYAGCFEDIHTFLTLAPDGDNWSTSRLVCFTLGKEPAVFIGQ